LVVSQPTISPRSAGFQDKGLCEKKRKTVVVMVLVVQLLLLLQRLVLMACEGETEALHAYGPCLRSQLEVLQPLIMAVTISLIYRWLGRQERV